MNSKNVGAFIKERRETLGISAEDLSKLVGVTLQAVSAWESGAVCPELDAISKLCEVLDISRQDLITGRINSFVRRRVENATEADFEIKLNNNSGEWISPYLYGTNLEHTRSNIWNGLSAQMIRNRKFAGKPSINGLSEEWYIIGERGYFCHAAPYTRHASEGYRMKRRLECNSQRILSFNDGQTVGMGQHSLCIKGGCSYDLRLVLRSPDTLRLRLELTSRDGKVVYASDAVNVDCTDWKTYELSLVPIDSDSDADLRLSFDKISEVTIGAVSMMPSENFRGMRLDVIQALKDLGVTIMRWPGGNFAGEYCWFDGLLPVDMRAPCESYMQLETQPHSMGYDYQELGIDDFIALCKVVGAEPFLTINAAWMTPRENAAFVEYCNGSEKTKYGALRVQRGYKEPYAVKLWSLGNEMGYGHMEGDNTAGGYAKVARDNANAMLAVSKDLYLCSSGPTKADFMKTANNLLADIAPVKSVHYYTISADFYNDERMKSKYYAFMDAVEEGRRLLRYTRKNLDESIALSFDEWNSWYAWYRPGSVMEGIQTALMFHMIIEEAKDCNITLACHFESVNEGTIRVERDGTSYLTAAGQALAAMKLHCGGSLLYARKYAVASERDGIKNFTLVNPFYDKDNTVFVPVKGNSYTATLYTSESIMPYSRFDEKVVVLKETQDGYMCELPPHSMMTLSIKEG